MNGHARRCLDAIKELGFEFDETITKRHANGKSYYTHTNAPDQALSVYGKMNEMVARVVVDRARQIAGLSTVGAKRNTQAIKDRRRSNLLAKKEREARDREELDRRADEIGEQRRRMEALVRSERDRKILADLMRPGNGR